MSSAVLLHNPASPHPSLYTRGQGGITEGLVKGALSVAASAYKALFTGPNCSIQVQRTATLLSAVFKSVKTYITVTAAATEVTILTRATKRVTLREVLGL